MLMRHGIATVNQTVLLRGVNDDAGTLTKLFRGLVKMSIKPYYLFHGDPITGTSHFRTGVEKAMEIYEELRGNLSGLALPTLALDLPDGGGKVPFAAPCMKFEDGRMLFRSFDKGFMEYN